MYEKLYEEYQNLLLTRDARRKEAGAYQTLYIKEFGELVNAVFEKKIDCIKKKKSISFCQMYLNRGDKVNINELDLFIQKEMDTYNRQLAAMLDDYEKCKNAGVSTDAEVVKTKSIYRKIAKLIHPDMHPEIEEIEELRDLWNRVTEAYGKNDDKTMHELEVLIYGLLEELELVDTHPEIEDIEEKIEQVKVEIDHIVSTVPYLYYLLFDDEESVKSKKEQLQSELDEYIRYEKELDEVLAEIMKNGVVIIWDQKS